MFKNCVFKPDVNTIKWCKAAGIRAIKTMAQTTIALIGTNTLISAVDWKVVASGVAMSGIVSILTSIAGIPEVKAEDE
jgi:hypothetical protein